MRMPQIYLSCTWAAILCGFSFLLAVSCEADSADDVEFATLRADAKKSFLEHVTPFVETYCTRCHGQQWQKGGINFQPALKNPGDSDSRRRWKQALANVKAHDMPPEDAKKNPTEEERQRFVDSIGKLKFLSPKDPGAFVIRRLTKVEYGNTLQDLFGVDPAVAQELPDEVSGEGYLNTLSPLQSEQYLGIANEVLNRILSPDGQPPHPAARPANHDDPGTTRPRGCRGWSCPAG